MTDTIEWGDTDERPRRSWLRLNRRRRVALTVAGALVAGGIVAWPPFTSWRADAAARQVQHVWERAQGYDNARLVTLAGVQRTLGALDRPLFARAVTEIEAEEATALDGLVRQARAIRTWRSDVAAARKAVVAALLAQARGLRAQAKQPAAITVDLQMTTGVDAPASAAAYVATTRVEALRKRHHLTAFVPSTERFRSAAETLAALRRPTDQPLHLRLLTSGTAGLTVTDLYTGEVVRRPLDATDTLSWQVERMFGQSVVGSVDSGTLVVPLDPSRPEHRIADSFVRSSDGSPMWLTSLSNATLFRVDESGAAVGHPVTLPDGMALTGVGTGSLLLATTPPPGEFNGPIRPAPYYLVRPGTAGRTDLAVTGCVQQPALGGGLVVLPTGNICDYATRLQVFDLTGRLVRTAPIPDGALTVTPPVCAPDGRHVALITYDAPPDGTGQTSASVRVLDTTTGTWTTVDAPGDWAPLDWSSDGTTLLLQSTDITRFAPNDQFGELAYLRAGETTLHSIRVAADQAAFLV